MTIKRFSLFFLLIFAVLLSTSMAEAQKKGKKPAPSQPEQIGRAAFPVSCKKSVQKTFDRGISLLHSFWYPEAEKAFTSVIQADSDCAMGYWGIAMSFYHPLWEAPDARALRRGWSFTMKAKKLAKTEREKGYITALEAFYHDSDRVDHAIRAAAYEKAMAEFHEKHPDDREGAVFYALSLLATAPPSDKSHANQKKAIEILNPILAEAPEHPGAVHYLIHAADSPELAEKGLDAARAYAKIAPSVPHALHMPSHIFIRLGLWQEAIDSNLASEAAAKTKMKGSPEERLHALDYLTYAYLQQGEDRKAEAIVKEAGAMPRSKNESLKTAYAFSSIPARYLMERRRWSEVMTLNAHPSRYPYAEAITYFTRAVGAARSNRIIEASGEVEVLRSVRDKLSESKDRYWADQVEILLQGAAAWVEYLDGKHDRALLHMRTAADLEDSLEKHPMTPAPILPARELLGSLLLEVGEAKAALAEFEKVLRNAPNRFNSLYGAARAAERAEDFESARRYYEKLVAVASPSGGRQMELSEAKVFLEKGSTPAQAGPAAN